MFKANNNNTIIDDLIWLADLKTNYCKVFLTRGLFRTLPNINEGAF